jgi:hypothetical protein
MVRSGVAMGRRSGTFEHLLDKATSQLLLATDWESILQICDLIRQGDTQAKYAVNSIKKKVNDKNPRGLVCPGGHGVCGEELWPDGPR